MQAMQVVSHNFLEASSKILQVEKTEYKQVNIVKHVLNCIFSYIHVGIGGETPSAGGCKTLMMLLLCIESEKSLHLES